VRAVLTDTARGVARCGLAVLVLVIAVAVCVCAAVTNMCRRLMV
jgi:hypothetical protein